MTSWVRFARDGGAAGFGTLDSGEGSIAVHRGDLFAAPAPTGEVLEPGSWRALAPVRPGKFIGLWNNFHALVTKTGAAVPTEPLWFLKAGTSLLDPDGIIRPPGGYAGKVLYEGELGLVIGRRCKQASEAEAAAAIFGLTAVNDITALDILNADPAAPQWARAKSCDGFGPIGPAIATGLDWSSLHVRVALNGRVRQDYPVADMIIPPARIISLLSREMTLEPGDVIACGTSVGALPMRPGMVVEVTIEGIGTLRNVFDPA